MEVAPGAGRSSSPVAAEAEAESGDRGQGPVHLRVDLVENQSGGQQQEKIMGSYRKTWIEAAELEEEQRPGPGLDKPWRCPPGKASSLRRPGPSVEHGMPEEIRRKTLPRDPGWGKTGTRGLGKGNALGRVSHWDPVQRWVEDPEGRGWTSAAGVEAGKIHPAKGQAPFVEEGRIPGPVERSPERTGQIPAEEGQIPDQKRAWVVAGSPAEDRGACLGLGAGMSLADRK